MRAVRTAAVSAALALVAASAAVVVPGLRGPRVSEAARDEATATTATTSTTQPPPISAADAEQAFTIALNARRHTIGVPPLTTDPALTDIARAWSRHMAGANVLSHNPNLVDQVPPGWHKIGENVGVGISVAAIHIAFLRSPEHYRNIADSGFTRVGIGVVVQGRIIWVTVDFYQPE